MSLKATEYQPQHKLCIQYPTHQLGYHFVCIIIRDLQQKLGELNFINNRSNFSEVDFAPVKNYKVNKVEK